MVKSVEILAALAAGQNVRRSEWEAITRMYVADGVLVCQRGQGKPYAYPLDWSDITANDWHVIEATLAA